MVVRPSVIGREQILVKITGIVVFDLYSKEGWGSWQLGAPRGRLVFSSSASSSPDAEGFGQNNRSHFGSICGSRGTCASPTLPVCVVIWSCALPCHGRICGPLAVCGADAGPFLL